MLEYMQVTPIHVLVDTVQRRISIKQRASDEEVPWLGPKKARKVRFPGMPRNALRLPVARLLKMQNVRALSL